MKKRRFGKTEMMVSQISLGCMRWGHDNGEKDSLQVILDAVDRGINHIETARGYGDSERRVGQALKRLFADKKVPRESLYVTTKIGPSSDVDEFKRNWEKSFNLLGLDYIDNLDFHGPGSLEQIGTAMRDDHCLGFVRKLQDQGLLRHFGFSTHGYPKGVMTLVETGEFESINLHYYFFNQGMREVVNRAAERDMGVFIISPSAQGGKLHQPTSALIQACAPLHPVTFNHMWLLNHPEVHTLSCGPSTPQELDRNLLAADYRGSGPERELFDQVAERVERIYREKTRDTFCTHCNQCLPCPENINIPGLLNWRNMAMGFEMEDFTRQRYSRVGQGGAWVPGEKGSQCTRCGECLPRCPEHLDIPALLWETHEKLETGEVGKPMWDHEGDLLKQDLKQS